MWFKCQVDIGQFSSVIRLGSECNPTCICVGERASGTEHFLTVGEGSWGSQERDHAIDCGELQRKGMQLQMLEKMLRGTNGSLYSFSVLCVCTYMSWDACGSQRTVYESWFFPSVIWALGIELRLSASLHHSFNPEGFVPLKLVPHQRCLHVTSLAASLRCSLGLPFKVRRQGHRQEFKYAWSLKIPQQGCT